MYYNRILKVWSVDALDCFLLGALISSILTQLLKSHLSERSERSERSEMKLTARLRKDIIRQSRNPDEFLRIRARLYYPYPAPKNSEMERVYRIYRFVFGIRGGQFKPQVNLDPKTENLNYKLAEFIRDVVVKLAVFIKTKELRARIFKFLFTNARLVLELLLKFSSIELKYFIFVDNLGPGAMVIAYTAGGATGFISAWFSVGRLLFGPPVLLAVFLTRSLAAQIIHNAEYAKFREMLTHFFKDPLIKGDLKDILLEFQNQNENSGKITLKHLEWNKDPKIKEAAEQLGIFKNSPQLSKSVEIDSEILKELGIPEKPEIDSTLGVRSKLKDKFSNLVSETPAEPNLDLDLDLGIIDAEIIEENITEIVE